LPLGAAGGEISVVGHFEQTDLLPEDGQILRKIQYKYCLNGLCCKDEGESARAGLIELNKDHSENAMEDSLAALTV
jgi:hypothetical protein